MVGVLSDCVISTETVPKLPLESRARMVTLASSPAGTGTILPSTNTDARSAALGSPGLICSTFCSVFFSPVEVERIKKNKFTLNVIADDRVIEKKDRGA